MKTIFFIGLVFLAMSCFDVSETKYTNEWMVAVIYTNGEQDTIICHAHTYKPTNWLSLVLDESCLITAGMHNHLTFVCGIRQYEIIEQKILPIGSIEYHKK